MGNRINIGSAWGRVYNRPYGREKLSGLEVNLRAGQKECLMKTFTKIWQIAAIGAIIAAGLSACITFSSAPPETEEEAALRDTLGNASWEVKTLLNAPSLTGFEKLSNLSIEFNHFVGAAGDKESDRGRTITRSTNGVERTVKLIGLNHSTWYALTAPELPGITFYYYRPDNTGKFIGDPPSIYKNKQ